MSSISEMVGVGIHVEHAQALVGSKNLAVSAAGTTQGDATELGTQGIQRVTTVGTNAGVILNDAFEVDSTQWVINAGANALDLYPPSGGTINGLSADAPFIVIVDAAVIVTRLTDTDWAVIGSPNS